MKKKEHHTTWQKTLIYLGVVNLFGSSILIGLNLYEKYKEKKTQTNTQLSGRR